MAAISITAGITRILLLVGLALHPLVVFGLMLGTLVTLDSINHGRCDRVVHIFFGINVPNQELA